MFAKSKINNKFKNRFIFATLVVFLFFIVLASFNFQHITNNFNFGKNIVAEAAGGANGTGRNSAVFYEFTTANLGNMIEFFPKNGFGENEVNKVGYISSAPTHDEDLSFMPFVDPNVIGYKIDSGKQDVYTWMKFKLSREMVALRRMDSLTISVKSHFWTTGYPDGGFLALGIPGLDQDDITYENFILSQPETFFQVMGEQSTLGWPGGNTKIYLDTTVMSYLGDESDEYFYLFANTKTNHNHTSTHGQFEITLNFTSGNSYKLANNAISIDGSPIPRENIGGEIKYRWNNSGNFATVTNTGESENLFWSQHNDILNLQATKDVEGYRFLGWAIFTSKLTFKPVIDVLGINPNVESDLALQNVKNKTQEALEGLAQWIPGDDDVDNLTNRLNLRRSSATGYVVPLEGSHIYAIYAPVYFKLEYRPGEAGNFANVIKRAPPFARYKTGSTDIFPDSDYALLSWEDTSSPANSYAPETSYVFPIVPQINTFDDGYITSTTTYVLIAKWTLVAGEAGAGVTATPYRRVFHDRYVDMYYRIELSGGLSIDKVFVKFNSGDLKNQYIMMDKDPDPNEPNGYIVPYASGSFTILASVTKETYNITYYYPSWSCSPSDSQKKYIPGIGLSSADLPIPTRYGYKFIGWRLNSYSGEIIKTNDQLKNLTGDISLYAYGEKVSTNAVTISDVESFNKYMEFSIDASSYVSYRDQKYDSGFGDHQNHDHFVLNGLNYQSVSKGGIYASNANESGDAIGHGWKSTNTGGTVSMRGDYYISFEGTALQYIRMGAKVEVYATADLDVGSGRNSHITSGYQGSAAMRFGIRKGQTSNNSDEGMFNWNGTIDDYSYKSDEGSYKMTPELAVKSAGWHLNSNHWRYDNVNAASAATDTDPLILDEDCAGVTISLFARFFDEHSSVWYANYARARNMKVYVRFSEGLVETNKVIYKGNGGQIPSTEMNEYSQTFGTTVDTPNYYSTQAQRNRVIEIRNKVQIKVAPNIFERQGYEFLGWSTSSSSTLPDANYGVGSYLNTQGHTYNVSSSGVITRNKAPITLYAVWQRIGRVVASYDVFVGNLNEDGGIYFRPRNTKVRTGAYYLPNNPQTDQNFDYKGFIRSTNAPSIYHLSHDSLIKIANTNHDYNAIYSYKDGNGDSILYPYISGIPEGNTEITQNLIFCYIWELNAPSVEATDKEVVYGTQVNLKDCLNFASIPASDIATHATYKISNGKDADEGTGWKRNNNLITDSYNGNEYYWRDPINNRGVIFEHIESSAYNPANIFQASIYYQKNMGNNIVLTSVNNNAINGGLRVYIYPIVLEVSLNTTNERTYDGTAQNPYFDIEVKSENQVVAPNASISNVYANELENINNNFNHLDKGLKFIISYKYKNFIDSESEIFDSGVKEFKNAGTYTINSLKPIYDQTDQHLEINNYNYVFKVVGDNQSANSIYNVNPMHNLTFARDLKDTTEVDMQSKNLDVVLLYTKKAYGTTAFENTKEIVNEISALLELSQETSHWLMFLDGITQADLQSSNTVDALKVLLVRQGYDASANETSWLSAPADDTDPVKDYNGNILYYEIALRANKLLKETYLSDASDPYNAVYKALANNYNFSAGSLDYSDYLVEEYAELKEILNFYNIFADQNTEKKEINYRGTNEQCFVGVYDKNAEGEGSQKGVWLEISQLEININWTTPDLTYNGLAQGKTGTITGILPNNEVDFYVENANGNISLGTISGSGTPQITNLTSVDAGSYYAKIAIANNNYVLANGDEVEWTIKKAQINFVSTSGYVTGGSYNSDGELLSGDFSQKSFTTDNIYEASKDYGYKWDISGIMQGDSVSFQIARYNNTSFSHDGNEAFPPGISGNIKVMTSYLTGQNCVDDNPTLTLTNLNGGSTLTRYFLAHNVGSYYFRIAGSISDMKNPSSTAKYTKSAPIGKEIDGEFLESDWRNYYIGQYTNDYTEHSFMITKRALSLSWQDVEEKTYNGDYQEILAFYVLGLQGLDEVKLKLRFPEGMQMVEEETEDHVVEDPTTVIPPNLTKDYEMNKNILSSSLYSIRAKDAKTYGIAVLQLEGKHKDNYDFLTAQKEATILKKMLLFEWSDEFNDKDNGRYVYEKGYIGPKLEISNIQSQNNVLDSIKLYINLPTGIKFQTQIRDSDTNQFVNTDIITPSPTNSPIDYETLVSMTNSTNDSFYRFLARDALANAGSYKATIVQISGEHASNYTLANVENLSKEFIIYPKPITLNATSETNFTYNGQSQGVTITASAGDIYSGDVVTFVVPSQGAGSNQYDYSGNNVSKPDYIPGANSHMFKAVYVANYRVVIYGSQNNNYFIKLTDDTIVSSTNPYTLDFRINKLKVGLTWGVLLFTYNGNIHTLSLPTINNKITGEDVNLSWNDGVGYTHAEKNKGNYVARISNSLTGTHADNYTLEGVILTKNWEIVPKLLTFTFNLPDPTPIYSKNFIESASLGINGICAGDNVKLKINATAGIKMQYNNVDYFNPAITSNGFNVTTPLVTADVVYKLLAQNAGSYNITIDANSIQGDSAENYKIDVTYAKTFSINKKVVSINAWYVGDFVYGSNTNVIYNSAHNQFTYDNTNKKVTAGYTIANSGVILPNDGKVYYGDNLSLSYTPSEGYQLNIQKNAGTYNSIVQTTNINYKLKEEKLTLEWKINQATVNIQFIEKVNRKISDFNYTYSGAEQGLYIKFTGIASEDYIKATVEKVGNFSVSGVLTGETEIENNVSYEFSAKHVNYDTVNNVVIPYVVKITQVFDSKGHTGVNSNYKFTVNFPVNKEFTINPVVLDFTWGADEITYTGSEIEYPLPTITNLVPADQSRIYLIKNETLSSPNLWKATAVGTYYAHLSENVGVIGSNGLYDYVMPTESDPNFNKMVKEWRIVKRIIEISQFESFELTYNQTFQIAKILKITGLQNANDDIKIKFRLSANLKVNNYSAEDQEIGASIIGADDYVTPSLNNYVMISSLTADATTIAGQLIAVQAKYGQVAPYQVSALSLESEDEAAANYELSQVSFNFNVAQKTINVVDWYIDDVGQTKYTSSSFVYDGSSKSVYPKGPNGSNLDFIAGDNVSIIYAGHSNSQINAGTYTTTITLGSDLISASYKLEGNTTLTNWIIAKRQILLSWSGDASTTWQTEEMILVTTYDSNDHHIFANILNKIATDDVSFVYNTNATNKDVSTTPYSRTITGLSGSKKDNYTLDGVDNLTKQWKILQRTIKFVWDPNQTMTYNGDYQGVKLNIENIAGNDVLSFMFDATDKVRGTSVSNCYVSTDDANDTISVTNTGVVLSVNFEAKDYGAYTVSINENTGITGVKAGNYNLTGQVLSKTWTIGKKQITFDVTSESPFTYFAQNEQGILVKVNGIVSGDNIVLETSTAGGALTTNELNDVVVNSTTNYNLKAINAGTYDTVVNAISGSSANNYQIPVALPSRTFSFVINKKLIEIIDWYVGDFNPDGGSVLYNSNSFVYDGTSKKVTAGFNIGAESANDKKVYDSDKYTISLLYNTGENPNIQINSGTYNTKVNLANSIPSANYTLSSTDPKLTLSWLISQRVIDLTWPSTLLFVYDGNQKNINATISNIVSGDTVGLVYQNTGTTEIGGETYTYTNSAINSGKYISKVIELVNNTNSNYRLPLESEAALYEKLSKQWEITKREILISWSGADSFEYNANWQGTELSASNFIASESIALMLDITSENPVNVTSTNASVSGSKPNFVLTSEQLSLNANIEGKNAGTFQADLRLADSYTKNYVLTGNLQKIFNITKKIISLAWSGPNSFIYNTENQGVSLTVSGILGSDANLVEFMLTIVGQISLIGAGIITTGQRKLKNGVHNFVAKDAGVYSVKVGENLLGESGANYTLTISPTDTCQFVIAKKNITIPNWYISTYTLGGSNTKYTNSSFTYDGSAKTVVPGYLGGATLANDGRFYTSDLSENMSDAFEFNEASDSNTQINAASYTTEARLSESSPLNTNYLITAGAVLNWLISQKTITVSFTGSSIFTYNGQNQGIAAVVNGIVETEQVKLTTVTNVETKGFDSTISISNGTYNFHSKNAGNYSVSITGVDNANYKLENPPIITDFTISKLTIQLSWGNTTFEYNAFEQGPSIPTISNLIANDTVSLSWDDNTTYTHLETNKGNYVAKISEELSGTSSENYTLYGVTLTKDWKIVAKKITFTFTSENLTYSGNFAQIGTMEVVGVYASDTVKINANVSPGVKLQYNLDDYFDVANGTSPGGLVPTTGLHSGVTYGIFVKDAGSYNFVINTNALLESHPTNNNYEIATTYSQTFTMQRRELSITFSEYYQTYLSAYSYEYSANYQGVRAEISNIVSGEEIYIHFNVTGGSPIKIYTDYSSNNFANDLGNVSNVQTNGNANFDVGFTAVNYGNYTASITHIIDTNGVSSVTGGNYSLPTTKSQSFNIEKKTLTINWQTTTTYVYDKTVKSVVATAGGLISPDVASFVYDETNELQDGRNLQSSAINYGLYRSLIIGLTAESNINYKLPTINLSKDWQIDQKVVDIIWPSTLSFVYDGTSKSVNGTVSNIISGDNISLVYQDEGSIDIGGVTYLYNNVAIPAGKYISKVIALDNNENSNYRLPLESETVLYEKLSKQWEITKRQINISFSGSSNFTYNGQNQGIDIVFSNLVANDCADNTLQITINVSDGVNLINIPIETSGNSNNFTYQVREIDAATYNISFVSMENTNYVIDLTQQASFTISKKVLTLDFEELFTPGMKKGSYEYTYSKGEQGISFSLNGILKRGASLEYEDVTLNASSNTPVSNSTFNNTFEGAKTDTISGSLTAINVIDGQYLANFYINHKNYTLDNLTNSISWKIAKKEIDIKILTLEDADYTDTSFYYDGTTKGIKAIPQYSEVDVNTSNPGVYFGDNVNFVYAGTRQAINANTYNATVNMASSLPSSNYYVNQNVIWKINQKAAIISWVGKNNLADWSYADMPKVIYDGTPHNIIAVVSNAIAGDSFTFTYTGSEDQVNVNLDGNPYSRTLTDVGNTNYTILESSNLTQTWEITPKSLVANWSGESQYVYANSLFGPTLTISGLVGSDTISYDATTKITNSSDSIIANNVANSSVVEISQDPQVFRVNALSAATFSTKYQAREYGLYEITNVSLVDSTVSRNYTLSVDTFQWTIGKKTIIFTFEGNTSLIYNAKNQGISIKISEDSIYENPANTSGFDEVTLNLTLLGNFEIGNAQIQNIENDGIYEYFGKNVGTYKITVQDLITGQDGHNYELSSTNIKTITFTIIPKEIYISNWYIGNFVQGSTENIVYDKVNHNQFTYDNTNKVVTPGYEVGATSDDDYKVYTQDAGMITFEYLSDKDLNIQKNANEYETTPKTLSTGVSANYVVVSNSTNPSTLIWKINKATVTLTLSPSTPPTYTYSAQEQGISYEITGIAANDTISLDVDFVGPFTTRGFLSGESLAQNTTYMFKGRDVYLSDGAVQSYEIKINSLTDSKGNISTGADCNYILVKTDASFMITQKTVTAIWGTYNYIYNGQEQSVLMPQVSGKLNGDIVGFSFTSDSVNKAINAGTYTAKVSSTLIGESTSNYSFDGSQLIWKIATKEINLVWEDDPNETLLTDDFSYTYTAKLIGVRLSLLGLIEGESASVKYANDGLVSTTSNYNASGITPDINNVDKHYFASINASEGQNISYYGIKITEIDDENYHINPLSSKTKSWAIVKKTLDLSFTYTSNAEVVYDGLNHGVILTIAGIQTNENSVLDELTLSYTATSGLNPSVENSNPFAIENTSYTFNAKDVLLGGYSLNINALGGAAKDNYKLILPAKATLNITPLELNVIWHGDEKVDAPEFDSSFETIYSGIERYVYAVPTNKITGDDIDFLYQNNTYTNASQTPYQAKITQIIGANATNYILSSSASAIKTWKINPREITIDWVDYSDGNIRYKTTGYTVGQDGDIKIKINNIVSGETLEENVTYSDALGNEVTSPTDVGTYVATIDLTLGTNYVLADGASNELEFKIYPYVISGSSLEWEYIKVTSGSSVTSDYVWGTPITFEDSDTYHNFNVKNINDALVQNVSISIENYYGLCSCALEATVISDVHLEHQWPSANPAPSSLPTSGPMHAGKYYLTLNLSGSNASNYVFDNFDDGYLDADYFYDQDGIKLKYPQISPNTAVHNIVLPDLEQHSAEFGNIKTKYVLTFNINKKVQGFNPGASTLYYTEAYLGKYYRHEPVLSILPADVLVDVTKKLSSTSDYTSIGTYTLNQYRKQPNNIKDVGDYIIHFYDTSSGGSSDCDNEYGTTSSIALTVL
ncbi:MAG TPA: hypothetical protein GX709_03585, partial [Clostridiales bacterium]|nr:hypothetical protein [Clostridiales bacterium]